jgi:class 3 adenylate cyclase
VRSGDGRTATAGSPAAPASFAVAEAERRQLTVIFCDLVGSTALSARFDPEDLREIVGAYHRAVADPVDYRREQISSSGIGQQTLPQALCFSL